MAPPAEKKTENESRVIFKKIDAAVTLGKTLIQYAALTICVYFAYRIVAVLAGKATFASVGLDVLGNIDLHEGICIVLTTTSIVYGVGERALRRRNMKRLTEKTAKLELMIDSGRTSSGLTRKGTTRPEDRI